MEAHPAHKSLPAKAKIEAMDVLTSAWTGNSFIYPLAPLYSSFHFFIHRASPSLPLCFSCPFHPGRKPGIDDDYSILWRYLPDISFTSNILKYETTDDHDDHGTQTRIISRVLLRVGQSILLKHLLPHLRLGSLVLSMFSPVASNLLPTQQTSSYQCRFQPISPSNSIVSTHQMGHYRSHRILSPPGHTLHIL